ncbi:hypothetical protein PROFUN_10674 [Planoprotostelium fungivorum]|uniref:F-box domain-containing protein n=1 Tax=Planoprotostelium fungivorum TaxID=1890364 RepID=A0A2P6MV24_9EUKA|nr:hypothetical protein PROFUN_10674 [Planoprotostelium fungivorum]
MKRGIPAGRNFTFSKLCSPISAQVAHHLMQHQGDKDATSDFLFPLPSDRIPENHLKIIKQCLDNAVGPSFSIDEKYLYSSVVLPGIFAKTAGLIGLPVPTATVKRLKERTTERRRTHSWEWKAKNNEFSIKNMNWMRWQITRQPGQHVTESAVDAELYKMILEVPGGRFSLNEEDERGEHFGYLSVILPTPHAGGNLTIRCYGEESAFSTETNSKIHHQWRFLSKGCQVQAEPITSGCRLQILFLLSTTSSVTASRARDDDTFFTTMQRAIEEWKHDSDRKDILSYGLNVSDFDRLKCVTDSASVDSIVETSHDIERVRVGQLRWLLNGAVLDSTWVDTQDVHDLRHSRGIQMFFYMNNDVEDFIIRYGRSSDYFQKLMSQACLDITERGGEENMGELKGVPDDIFTHFLSRYVPVADMDRIQMTSRKCRDLVTPIAWSRVQSFVERVLSHSNKDILFNWKDLAERRDLLLRFDGHERILKHMAPMGRESCLNHATSLLQQYGWREIGPKMTSCLLNVDQRSILKQDTIKGILDMLLQIPAAKRIHSHFLHRWKSFFLQNPQNYPFEPVFSHVIVARDDGGIEMLWNVAREQPFDFGWFAASLFIISDVHSEDHSHHKQGLYTNKTCGVIRIPEEMEAKASANFDEKAMNVYYGQMFLGKHSQKIHARHRTAHSRDH